MEEKLTKSDGEASGVMARGTGRFCCFASGMMVKGDKLDTSR
jgi:hypothetical protein